MFHKDLNQIIEKQNKQQQQQKPLRGSEGDVSPAPPCGYSHSSHDF